MEKNLWKNTQMSSQGAPCHTNTENLINIGPFGIILAEVGFSGLN